MQEIWENKNNFPHWINVGTQVKINFSHKFFLSGPFMYGTIWPLYFKKNFQIASPHMMLIQNRKLGFPAFPVIFFFQLC